MELKTGLVVTGHGRHYVVESEDGERRLCHPRGKKSQAVVGDRVQWQLPKAGQGEEGSIERIAPRRNLFYRQDEVRTKAFAANIDQILVLLAAEPVFSEWQLAKALVAAEAAGIAALIGLNKQDLQTAHARAWERLRAYREEWPKRALSNGASPLQNATRPSQSNGALVTNGHTRPNASLAVPLYPVLALELDGAHGGTDFAELRERLAGKTTLVLGPSGAGKSTLINRLIPDAQAQTREISRALNSGKHTTTTTNWYWVNRAEGTAVLDSPGFQEFGLHHIRRQELPAWMPDIGAHASGCRYYNCSHVHEPGCVVRAAVVAEESTPPQPASGTHLAAEPEDGAHLPPPAIAATRYALYVRLLDDLPQ